MHKNSVGMHAYYEVYTYIASKILLKYNANFTIALYMISPHSSSPLLPSLHQIQSDGLQESQSYLDHDNVQVIRDTPPSLASINGATHLKNTPKHKKFVALLLYHGQS